MDLGPQLLPFPARVHRGILSCGMRLVAIEVAHLHATAVALFVRSGSRFETPKTNGLSHFVEHMLFRGSEHYPHSFALNNAIEERCGMLSGETGRDYSLYQVCMHPDDLGESLAILGDLFSSPRFSDIDLERAIVLEEILDDFDEKGQRVNIDDVARDLAFPDHPLGFPIIGPEKNIRRFSRADVVRHFQKCHGARNMVLAVAGPNPAAQVKRLAQKSFAGLAPGTLRTALPPPRTFPGGQMKLVRTDSSQVEIQVLFRALPDPHPGFPALLTLLRVLDDGMSTRLHYRICDRKGLAYHVNAGMDSLGDISLMEVTATCAPKKLPDLTAEILTILRELRESPIHEAELAKAKRRYTRDLEAGFDDVEGLAAFYGGNLIFNRPIRTPVERYRRMAKVTAADVATVAKQILQQENMVTIVVGNISQKAERQVRSWVKRF